MSAGAFARAWASTRSTISRSSASRGRAPRPWLDGIMAGRVPKEGRLTLSPLLNKRGRLAGDFTIASDGPESFRVQASYVAQDAHMRLFLDLLPGNGVTVTNISRALVGFQIAGPRARDLLQRHHGCRCVWKRHALPRCPPHHRRRGRGHRAESELHRGSRLRDLRAHRLAECPLRDTPGRRRPVSVWRPSACAP